MLLRYKIQPRASVVHGLGMTLLEVLVAMAILAVATLGALMTFMSTNRLDRLNEQDLTISNKLLAKIAEVNARYYTGYTHPQTGEDFTGIDAVVAYYQVAANTTSQINDMDEATGTIEVKLYLDETSVPVALGAQAVNPGDEFGSMDLDGDGQTNGSFSTTVDTAQYGLDALPVEVKATWTGTEDTITTTRYFLISRKEN